MFNLDKVIESLKGLSSAMEEHRKKNLRANLAMTMFSRIMDLSMKDEDLVATAKVSVHMTDIILKELGEV
ncbi:MAG: hypothetical protein H7836_04375 [Magnetococcus sp. YQC-3]